MKFEYIQGKEVLALALKISHVVPKGITNHTVLGALGSIVATALSGLLNEVGEEAIMKVLEDWTSEIVAKTMMLGKLQAEGFDFEAWAAARPTVGEA